jgi:hypothetical protein
LIQNPKWELKAAVVSSFDNNQDNYKNVKKYERKSQILGASGCKRVLKSVMKI